uniref:Uncharacterized protein n=1 Tax=Timema cristinae TaxID=61476 RepID=A0A7R9GTA1_TIMCR|nr:unnamed protein product [Timema cristinae]
MGEDRLSDIALLNIEGKILQDMDFNDICPSKGKKECLSKIGSYSELTSYDEEGKGQLVLYAPHHQLQILGVKKNVQAQDLFPVAYTVTGGVMNGEVVCEKSSLVATLDRPSTRHLTWFQKVSYGMGHIFNDICAAMWFSYILLFLQVVIGMPPALSGAMMLTGTMHHHWLSSREQIPNSVPTWLRDRQRDLDYDPLCSQPRGAQDLPLLTGPMDWFLTQDF